MPEDSSFFIYLSIAVTALAFLVFGLSAWNLRQPHPLRALINRWARWLLFSLVGAFILDQFADGTRPFAVWWTISFLGWFLGESILTWMAVKSLSFSQFPLFPRFEVPPEDSTLPADAEFLHLRDQLKKAGFSRKQTLRADLPRGLRVQLMVYLTEDDFHKLQVFLIPHPTGASLTCFSVFSKNAQGEVWVTDNIFLPFGGFYPPRWRMQRFPLRRSFESIWSIHQRRIKQSKSDWVPWDDEWLSAINEEQRNIEKLNEEAGLILPYSYREEHGLLSVEGRYRLWKEIWLMNYFGMPMSHRPPPQANAK